MATFGELINQFGRKGGQAMGFVNKATGLGKAAVAGTLAMDRFLGTRPPLGTTPKMSMGSFMLGTGAISRPVVTVKSPSVDAFAEGLTKLPKADQNIVHEFIKNAVQNAKMTPDQAMVKAMQTFGKIAKDALKGF